MKKTETICINSKVDGRQPSLEDRIYHVGGLCPTIATCFPFSVLVYMKKQENDMAKRYRIRKLTERECFRLMGVPEQDIDKIQSAGIPRSQQYKLAGNSIVVPVLEAIFIKLFSAKESDNETLFG